MQIGGNADFEKLMSRTNDFPKFMEDIELQINKFLSALSRRNYTK